MVVPVDTKSSRTNEVEKREELELPHSFAWLAARNNVTTSAARHTLSDSVPTHLLLVQFPVR